MPTRALCAISALRRDRGGVAAVEFALSASVLVLLMAGVIGFGVACRTRMQVGNAARAGAAYAQANGLAATGVLDAAGITGIVSAAQAATVLSTVKVTLTQYPASCVDPATNAIAPASGAQTCPATGSAPGTYVKVTTELPYTLIWAPPGMTPSMTLTGVAVARLK